MKRLTIIFVFLLSMKIIIFAFLLTFFKALKYIYKGICVKYTSQLVKSCYLGSGNNINTGLTHTELYSCGHTGFKNLF